jgi:hypothetical protein
VAESLRWVTQLMNAAETYGDPDLLIVGHRAALNAHLWLGNPVKTREHGGRVLALYDESAARSSGQYSEPRPENV